MQSTQASMICPIHLWELWSRFKPRVECNLSFELCECHRCLVEKTAKVLLSWTYQDLQNITKIILVVFQIFSGTWLICFDIIGHKSADTSERPTFQHTCICTYTRTIGRLILSSVSYKRNSHLEPDLLWEGKVYSLIYSQNCTYSS